MKVSQLVSSKLPSSHQGKGEKGFSR